MPGTSTHTLAGEPEAFGPQLTSHLLHTSFTLAFTWPKRLEEISCLTLRIETIRSRAALTRSVCGISATSPRLFAAHLHSCRYSDIDLFMETLD